MSHWDKATHSATLFDCDGYLNALKTPRNDKTYTTWFGWHTGEDEMNKFHPKKLQFCEIEILCSKWEFA